MQNGIVIAIAVGGMVIVLLVYLGAIKPRRRIRELEDTLKSQRLNYQLEIDRVTNIHRNELDKIEQRLNNSTDLNLGLIKSEMADILLVCDWELMSQISEKLKIRAPLDKRISEQLIKRVQDAVDGQYLYQFLTYLYPELEFTQITDDLFKINSVLSSKKPDRMDRMHAVMETVDILRKQKTAYETILMKNRIKFLESLYKFDTSCKYISRLMADYETYEFEVLAKELDWGHAQRRMDKVASIREIRADARNLIEEAKLSEYRLTYLFSLFPDLEQYLDANDDESTVDYDENVGNCLGEDAEQDEVFAYVSKEEYDKMSETARNQLALDRYKGRKRTKWQVGRDYELYISHKYRQKGYEVEEYGSYMGMNDLGRDLIAKKDGSTLIIQCKYWSQTKKIHEKHIFQLYGTTCSYCMDNPMMASGVKGVLITNIELSPMAKKMADYLGVSYKENMSTGDYPSIKCNVREGNKIYHLPFDQKYDDTIIKNRNECYATTVKEAEDMGFRRARRWNGL